MKSLPKKIFFRFLSINLCDYFSVKRKSLILMRFKCYWRKKIIQFNRLKRIFTKNEFQWSDEDDFYLPYNGVVQLKKIGFDEKLLSDLGMDERRLSLGFSDNWRIFDVLMSHRTEKLIKHQICIIFPLSISENFQFHKFNSICMIKIRLKRMKMQRCTIKRCASTVIFHKSLLPFWKVNKLVMIFFVFSALLKGLLNIFHVILVWLSGKRGKGWFWRLFCKISWVFSWFHGISGLKVCVFYFKTD